MNARNLFLLALLLFSGPSLLAQFALELQIDYAMRVQNSDLFSVSGTIMSGRVEAGKTYYLESGEKVEIKNLISSKSATSVPVATVNENVSISMQCKNFEGGRGEMLRLVSGRGVYTGSYVPARANKMPEGKLACKLNSRQYIANQVSKPVYIRQADVLDLFFTAEDESVIWIQLNNFSEITATPHQTRSDTSEKDRAKVCKLAFMPKGYRPTDMPNNYVAFEDVKGNAGILITYLDRYRKKIGFDFSGILRPNERMLEERPNAGLFYINDGHVDEVSWDEF